MKFIYSLLTVCLLLTACDRGATVERAERENRELTPVPRNNAEGEVVPGSTADLGDSDEQVLIRAESPLKDLSQSERNAKLMEVTDDEVANQAIAFMESRIDLTEEQKETIYRISDELNLNEKGAADRRAALKALRKRIKTDVLTADQMRQFVGNRR